MIRTDQRLNKAPSRTAATCWLARARELAAWADRLLVVRRDVFGGYLPLNRRDPKKGLHGPITKPGKADRGKVLLTEPVLVQHFAATRPEHVIGLHSTSPACLCRWAAVDIDQHGDHSPNPAVTSTATLSWYKRLVECGFTPLLTDSNGRGGYHLRVIFREPVPSPRAFALMRWLVSDHAVHGLTAPPETFPKQAWLPAGGYGNWLRLPGRHHSREHWSTVWDGKQWLDGESAVAHILALTGDSPSQIPPEVQAQEPPRVRVTVRFVPAHRPRNNRTSLDRRISAYMAKLPNLCEGQGRDDVAFQFAAWLVRDLDLSDAAALPWLEQWDQRNEPPKGTDRLRSILTNARRYGTHPIACGTDWRDRP
jgi:hypothetical protein